MEDRVWNKIDSSTLVSGADWVDAQSTVRALVFGKLVELGHNKIKFYRSDLYHDAIYLLNTLKGEHTFDWIARESGTFIGDVTSYVRDDWEKLARYRFDIRLDGDHKWVLDIYEAGPIVPVIPHFCEECGIMVAYYVDYMQMWLCSTGCTVKAENRLNSNINTEVEEEEEFILDDEFKPYFSEETLPTDIDYSENEAYQVQLEKEHKDLPVTKCNDATQIAGCIYHPAPYMVNCTGHIVGAMVQHDGDTCPQHENDGSYGIAVTFPDNSQGPRIAEDNWYRTEGPGTQDLGAKYMEAMMAPFPEILVEIPTLRNVEPKAQMRKENKMESIIRDLREKYEEASGSKETLEEYQSNINDAVDELDTYMSDLDDLISSLDQLPEISVYVDLETISFDS